MKLFLATIFWILLSVSAFSDTRSACYSIANNWGNYELQRLTNFKEFKKQIDKKSINKAWELISIKDIKICSGSLCGWWEALTKPYIVNPAKQYTFEKDGHEFLCVAVLTEAYGLQFIGYSDPDTQPPISQYLCHYDEWISNTRC